MRRTPHDVLVEAVLYAWEETAVEARLSIPEIREAAERAIAALRSEGCVLA